MTSTKFEKIGDTIFPVTTFPNGLVVVDYPNTLFPNKKYTKEEKETFEKFKELWKIKK